MDRDLATKCTNRDEMKQLIRNSCQGLMGRDNLDAALQRVDVIADHAQKLLNEGRTVSDWQSGRADNGQKIAQIISNPSNETSYISRLLERQPNLKHGLK